MIQINGIYRSGSTTTENRRSAVEIFVEKENVHSSKTNHRGRKTAGRFLYSSAGIIIIQYHTRCILYIARIYASNSHSSYIMHSNN